MSFNIYNKTKSKREYTDILKDNWKNWKQLNTETRTIFFPITKDFEKIHLKDISGGACKLYVFLGLKAGEMGHSWYSINKMAESLNVTPRTIDKWLHELEDRGLIARDRKSITSTTYLLPYSLNIIDIENNVDFKNGSKLLEIIIERAKREKEAVGSIFRAYHIFQWEDYKKLRTTQILLIITEKKYVVGSNIYTAYVVIDHVYDSKYVIDMNDVTQPRRFESWIESPEINIIGIALEKNDPLIKKRHLKDAIQQLCEIPENLISEIKSVPTIKSLEFINQYETDLNSETEIIVKEE